MVEDYIISILLTPAQKEELQKACGREVCALELTVEELKEHLVATWDSRSADPADGATHVA